MRISLILLLVLVLSACVDHPEVKGLDIVSIEQTAETLRAGAQSESTTLTEDQIPAAIKALKPKEVRVDNVGVYIVLQRNPLQESGLYISPLWGGITSVSGGANWMPEMKKVQGITYTYIL
ncbi:MULTISPECIES: hypothetical protein [unclassified Pseudoalteromonas]|uniref:hypothetical protein n=1 Tax=unclassified Pseudoalteromonas TaxID=194690 RepID=UPI000CF6F00E|nr:MULTISPECIES: hypothetical protein [unclassified Pseudoalteromonas]